jgi:hypothetical protein
MVMAEQCGQINENLVISLPPDLKADWSIESGNHPVGYISLFRFCSAVADSRQALFI